MIRAYVQLNAILTGKSGPRHRFPGERGWHEDAVYGNRAYTTQFFRTSPMSWGE